jgi:hypothetical protein
MIATTVAANALPANATGGKWIVQNLGTEAIYVARTEAGATTAAGVKLAAFEAIEVDVPTHIGEHGIWVVTSTGTADVRVIKS